MECEKTHRYVIATHTSVSEPYEDTDEAREFAGNLPEGSGAVWVAFHEVGVEQLVKHPDTVQAYCEAETRRQENLDREARKKESVRPAVSLKKQ